MKMWNLVKETFLRLLGVAIMICAFMHCFDLLPIEVVGIKREGLITKPYECLIAFLIGSILLLTRFTRFEDLSENVVDKAEDFIEDFDYRDYKTKKDE